MPGVIAGGDKSEARRTGGGGSWDEVVTPPHQLGVNGVRGKPSERTISRFHTPQIAPPGP